MTLSIHKYPLLASSDFKVQMPLFAEILSIQFQNDVLQVWALVDINEASFEVRKFNVYGTGRNISRSCGIHRATVQQGPFVWHVFEEYTRTPVPWSMPE